MTKNLMPEVLKMLGVEYGERFKLYAQETQITEDDLFYFDENIGLVNVTKDDAIIGCSAKLGDILTGYYEIVKLPWEPALDELYYYPDVLTRKVVSTFSMEGTRDFALIALGMAYRTKEEAEAHFAEDYEKLTGKKLEG